jgi:hypothetical protein
MGVVRPGTIGPHPKGWNAVEDGRRRLFWFAMQSRRRRKKVDDGSCGKTIEAKPVFGQTQAIRGRSGAADREVRKNMKMAIGHCGP